MTHEEMEQLVNSLAQAMFISTHNMIELAKYNSHLFLRVEALEAEVAKLRADNINKSLMN